MVEVRHNGVIFNTGIHSLDGIVRPGTSPGIQNTGTLDDIYLEITVPNTAQGPKGDKGDPGVSIKIMSPVRTPTTIPAFASTNEGEGYVVDNGPLSPGSSDQYDLYMHNIGGTNWDIIADWQGIPGPQGPPGTMTYVPIVYTQQDWNAMSNGQIFADAR